MSWFTEQRDKITGYKQGKDGKTDYKKTAASVLGAAAILTPQGREFMMGKDAKYDKYNVDPNFATYQEGLLRTTQALEDPNRNPYFRAAMKKAGTFHPGGGRDRAFAMASLAGVGAANSAYGGAYEKSSPIVNFSGPTTGALPGLVDAYGRYRGAKEGAKSEGVQTPTGGQEMERLYQMLQQMNFFRDQTPIDQGPSSGVRKNASAEGAWGY